MPFPGSVFEMAIIAVSVCYVPDAQSLYLDKVTIPIHCINPNDPDEVRDFFKIAQHLSTMLLKMANFYSLKLFPIICFHA